MLLIILPVILADQAEGVAELALPVVLEHRGKATKVGMEGLVVLFITLAEAGAHLRRVGMLYQEQVALVELDRLPLSLGLP